MSKYIDADKLYEYLEQVGKCYPRYADNIVDNAVSNVIDGIKTFVASLQQEQPSEDLEEGIVHYPSYKKGYFDGREDEKEQMMKEAVEGYAEKDLGWISVKDRLPSTTDYMFTCVKMDGIPQCVGFHYYKDGKWWEGYEEDSVGAVEYWMPIPKFKED